MYSSRRLRFRHQIGLDDPRGPSISMRFARFYVGQCRMHPSPSRTTQRSGSACDQLKCRTFSRPSNSVQLFGLSFAHTRQLSVGDLRTDSDRYLTVAPRRAGREHFKSSPVPRGIAPNRGHAAPTCWTAASSAPARALGARCCSSSPPPSRSRSPSSEGLERADAASPQAAARARRRRAPRRLPLTGFGAARHAPLKNLHRFDQSLLT